MQKNKDLVIFTYDFPFGKSEKTFIKYEIENLSKDFENIEIINLKSFQDNILSDFKGEKIKFNKKFSSFINIKSIFYVFFGKILFKKFFWKEIFFLIFKKKFFKKLKICVSEACHAVLLCDFIKREKKIESNTIFYSFWSNFPLISFIDIKKKFKNLKFIARGLGSDLNGYIENDDYVAFKNIKFSELDKLILLGDYQKEKLKNLNLENKYEIAPLGVFSQKINLNIGNEFNLDEPIIFTSCGNLIDIKNNFLMIDFLKKFTIQTGRKIKYIMIGDGVLKEKLLKKISMNNEIIFQYYEYVENFVNFLKQNKTHFFLNFSSQEGMPFTIMESMSCGIPSIVSNIPPNKNLVKDNGFMFDLNNYEESVLKMINEINETLNNKRYYHQKSLDSFEFINKNLINSQCYQKMKTILDNL